MAELGKLWAGRAFGTNTGNLFAEIDSQTGVLAGTLRFSDTNFGLVIYKLKGMFDGSKVELEGDAIQSPPNVVTGHVTAKAVLTPSGNLKGQWGSSLGTAGTFELYPHDGDVGAQDNATGIPEQLHTQRIQVGAIRLYAQDVRSLAQVVKRDFSSGRIVVTYRSDGIENSRYIEDFEADASKLGEINYFRLNIQEPEAHGLNRNTMVELNAQGTNQIVAQGIYESWVIGKAEAVARNLRHYQKPIVTNVKRWGVTFNQIVLVVMLLSAPEIPTLLRRLSFAAIVILLLALFTAAHKRWVPTAQVFMAQRTPGIFERAWPIILSWLIAATATLAASYAFYVLNGKAPP